LPCCCVRASRAPWNYCQLLALLLAQLGLLGLVLGVQVQRLPLPLPLPLR
jgi:hypothetical protein